MKDSFEALERKLNQIIDNELEKDVSEIDDSLVMECCDGLLRMEDINRYMITEDEMKKSVASVFGNKAGSVKRMKRSIRAILIAAIIAILLAVGVFGYAQYKYNIFNFSDHSAVLFNNTDKRRVNDFNASFIPNGFVLNYEVDNKYEHLKEYVKGDRFFSISKQTCVDKIDINTEYKGIKETEINGIVYIEYGEAEHGQGIVWQQDGYRYIMNGNISKSELLKIAISVSNN